MNNRGYINRCLRWLVNELYPFYSNNNLPHELNDKMEVFYDSIKDALDWDGMTRKDLLRLGFMNWDADDDDCPSGVWFIPNWLFPAIPEGLTVYDANGRSCIFSSGTASTEIMYGCLTYGILEAKDGTDNE